MNAPHPVELLLKVDAAGGDDTVVARTTSFASDDTVYLGTMDRDARLRTAGVFLRRALDEPVLEALLAAASVGLDGADEDSTGFPADVLDQANDALVVLRGEPVPEFTLYVGGRRDEFEEWCRRNGLAPGGPRVGWMRQPDAAAGLHVRHLRVVYGSRDGYSDARWAELARGVDALRVGTGTVEEGPA